MLKLFLGAVASIPLVGAVNKLQVDKGCLEYDVYVVDIGSERYVSVIPVSPNS